MNLAVGGDFVGNPSTNSINPSLPNEMQVDYVRVFQSVFVPTLLILTITRVYLRQPAGFWRTDHHHTCRRRRDIELVWGGRRRASYLRGV